MQEQNQPGAVVTPGGAGTVLPPPPQTLDVQPMTPQPIAPEQPVQPFEPQQIQSPAYSNPEPMPSPFASNAEQQFGASDSPEQDGLFMTWQSQETEEHDKQSRWYAAVALVAVALTGVVFLLTEKDILVSAAVFLSVLGFAYLASHKPKEQQYALAEEGIYVGEKLRLYEEFKNFSEVEETSGPSIILIPHKRFASPLVLKLTHDTIEAAVGILTRYLPIEERKLDAVDQLVRRIRL